jgi:hypothetical protein
VASPPEGDRNERESVESIAVRPAPTVVPCAHEVDVLQALPMIKEHAGLLIREEHAMWRALFGLENKLA